MQTDIREIYQKSIFPLQDKEKLEIATLILEEVTGRKEIEERKTKTNGGIREMFGTWEGKAADSDEYQKLDHNEQIDFELAKAYADNHEDED